MPRFKFYQQFDVKDCGPTCLRMIAKYYGKEISLEKIRKLSYITKDGVTLMGLTHASESLGLKTFTSEVDLETLTKKAPLPCIITWNNNHLVVLYKANKKYVYLADPGAGFKKLNHHEIKDKWCAENGKGTVVLLNPTPKFYVDDEEEERATFSYFIKYFIPHKNLLVQLFFAIIFSSLVSLLSPFITQSVVDIGILGKNINFIYLILASQFMLTAGTVFVSFIQAWISLHLSIRISLSFVIGYVAKLLTMPLSFFELKSTGDILKRIGDNSRIESFINQMFFSIAISVFNFIIYSFILAYYDYKLFLVFLLGNLAYIGWILLFLKKRRKFDYESFEISAESENKLLQLVYGSREIILNNIQKEKRWEWEKVQSKAYRLSKKILLLGQFQSTGATIINSLFGILVSIMVATAVIEGSITFGMMLSIQFIMGQIQAPLGVFLKMTHSYQDAKISLERLSEVVNNKEEETSLKSQRIPHNGELVFENVSFQYEKEFSDKVLNGINLKIPHKSTTAIVGASGSGKTTLLKLLLKLYPPTEGQIKVGGIDLQSIGDYYWRENCGVVMQDNYIFDDTILNNIILKTQGKVDIKRLHEVVDIANIKEWIEGQALNYQTKIGNQGKGLSQGQKQRLLIARALYKDPSFIFFDEATNSLDSENERIIINNLISATKNKTVVVIAHRLSTIKNADKIVVLDNGVVLEEGTHTDLLGQKGHYYNLVNNQLL
ncbi:peptidase domain-containing ABC transporter [Flagellimonas onchidii]|uniref:peptidase domain-containing ABC transporter n=1 Tax=Flagellimonas onchidii TaxID=2562684 RepID=UPI0010A5CC1C|nr:peptidase domain-containing ABC transporter [Allomuricauda onchidii]